MENGVDISQFYIERALSFPKSFLYLIDNKSVRIFLG